MSGQPVSLRLEVTPEALWQLEQERHANHQRELERLQITVALKVVGWMELPVDSHEERLFMKPQHLQTGDPYDMDAPLSELPAYSTDRNACAEAEQMLIADGRGARYSAALIKELGGMIPAHALPLITASAEVRCRAMLSAIRGKK